MEQYFPFQMAPLPYSYIALMPRCDANTLYYHHDDYYSRAVYELNDLVVRHRLTDRSLRQLVTEDVNLPTAQRNRLKDLAGAVFNHQLFFEDTSCKAGAPPFNRLTQEIETTYGPMSQFQQLFTEAAESLIGSGWVWLVAEGDKGLHIATTQNNEVVALDSVTPILVLDMWEHAYLHTDHFDKAAYVDMWSSLINWTIANQRYIDAVGTGAVG